MMLRDRLSNLLGTTEDDEDKPGDQTIDHIDWIEWYPDTKKAKIQDEDGHITNLEEVYEISPADETVEFSYVECKAYKNKPKVLMVIDDTNNKVNGEYRETKGTLELYSAWE